MPLHMCSTCGTEFAASDAPPASCPICEDERQFVNPHGQSWTSLERLALSHSNVYREEEPGLIAIAVAPQFAIGQRAFLVRTPAGNILWDCVPLVDAATRTIIEALGGLKAIAISHPHYYSAMVAWSETFGDVPILLHEGDREWVMRPSRNISFWSGASLELLPGVTAVHAGGHFAGGTVLHWADGAEGRGVMLVGDILQVTLTRQHVSFMRSYPNYMPLSASVVHRTVERLQQYPYDRMYGAFSNRVIPSGARAVVDRSAQAYADAVAGRGPADAEP